ACLIQPSSSRSTSAGDCSRTRCVHIEFGQRSSRPPIGTPSSLSPMSTRVLVAGWVSRNWRPRRRLTQVFFAAPSTSPPRVLPRDLDAPPELLRGGDQRLVERPQRSAGAGVLRRHQVARALLAAFARLQRPQRHQVGVAVREAVLALQERDDLAVFLAALAR